MENTSRMNCSGAGSILLLLSLLRSPLVSCLSYCGCRVSTRCGKDWGATEYRLQAPQLVLADRKSPVEDCSSDSLWMVFQLEILMRNEFIE